MDRPNKGEEIAESVEKNRLCLSDGHEGRKDRKG